MRLHSRFASIVLATISFLLICAAGGCGKKGNPQFAGNRAPERICDLRVDKENGVPLLRWTGAWKDSSGLRFKILRSPVRPEDCPDCPHEFSVIEEGADGDVLKEKTKNATWIYRDATAKKGGTYIYRVVVCDTSDNCSDPSNPVMTGDKKQPTGADLK